jgi:hypothetical protein
VEAACAGLERALSSDAVHAESIAQPNTKHWIDFTGTKRKAASWGEGGCFLDRSGTMAIPARPFSASAFKTSFYLSSTGVVAPEALPELGSGIAPGTDCWMK